jgi:hypothetical protein
MNTSHAASLSTNPGGGSIDPAPAVGLSISDPMNLTLYAMDPKSALSNTLAFVVSNPTPKDIPWAPGAFVEIVLDTSDSDPLAVLTPEAVQNLAVSFAGCQRAWAVTLAQGPASATLTLTPAESAEPLLGRGEHSELVVSIERLRSDLPLTNEPIPLIARAVGFPSLQDAEVSFSFVRQACPPPTGTFWVDDATEFCSPLLAAWSVQWAETLVVSFSNGYFPDIEFDLSSGQIALDEARFVLTERCLASGRVSLTATNLSNANLPLALSRKTAAFTPFCNVKKTFVLDLNQTSNYPDSQPWSFSPAPEIVKNAPLAPYSVNSSSGPQTIDCSDIIGFALPGFPSSSVGVHLDSVPPRPGPIPPPGGVENPNNIRPGWQDFAVFWPWGDSYSWTLSDTEWDDLDQNPRHYQGDSPFGPWTIVFRGSGGCFFVDTAFPLAPAP